MAVPAEATPVQSRPQSVTTLHTIVELVRRIMHADVTSILGFSLADKIVTWKAASGFRTYRVEDINPRSYPIANRPSQRALESDSVMILQGIGVNPELPAADFPVHATDGVSDLAVAPLKAGGQTLGALVAGYRESHHFTADEKQLLQDLAEMAALAFENARLLESIGAAEQIWEQTFDAIREGIIVHDEKMRIIRCNALAAEMMNLQPVEVVGLSFSVAFARLFGKRAAAYYLAESRQPTSAFEVQAEDERRYLVSIFPVTQTSGSQVSVVTWNDVTRMSEMQEQLARSRRLASVGQLAAGVAHEINNPLAAITTCAEATMRDIRRDSETQALAESHQWTYYLEEIVRQALRCKDITRGLLDLTRQRQAKRVMCDVNAIATECAKVAVQKSSSAAIEFEVNLQEGLGEVATDAPMIRQVIDNLLSNAIDALGEAGGTIKITTVGDADRLAVEVADSGTGISSELLSSIFDPFFSTKGAGKGYGLGLAICSTLAESLGGAITVESREGAGSRFRLWIPRRGPE
jgi:two-component system NtrC family sensor kinase